MYIIDLYWIEVSVLQYSLGDKGQFNNDTALEQRNYHYFSDDNLGNVGGEKCEFGRYIVVGWLLFWCN